MNIWKHETDFILDVCISNLDAPYYINRNMSVKRRKTSKSAWTNAATSLPLRFHACDRVLGNEANVVLQNLAGSLAKKSGKSNSEMSNFMKSWMIERATHLCAASVDRASPRAE